MEKWLKEKDIRVQEKDRLNEGYTFPIDPDEASLVRYFKVQLEARIRSAIL